MNNTPIDERELPFSEREFYHAFRLILPEFDAREAAAYVTSVVSEARESRQLARHARERGSTDRREVQEGSWIIGDEAFALLAEISPDLEARVETFIRTRWEAERRSWIAAARYKSSTPEGTPSSDELATAERELAAYAEEWEAARSSVREQIASFRQPNA